MQQLKENKALLGIVALVVAIFAVCILFFVWNLFFKIPVVSVRPNSTNLMMYEVLEKDNVVVSKADLNKHGVKLRTRFPVSITVQNGRIDLDRYHRDFPDNVSATWSSEWELPHAFQYSPISADEFRKKYVTRW